MDGRFPDNSKGIAIIMIGIPGSGKSTFVQQQLSFARRINLDTLHTRAKERKLLQECIAAMDSFVVDNTNPTRADRATYIQAAKDAGYYVIGCYMQSSISACINRNAGRKGKARVPNHVIAHISRLLELPNRSEGFDRLYYIQATDGSFIVKDWEDADEL